MRISRFLQVCASLGLSLWAASAWADGAYVSDRALASINRANAWFRSDFAVVEPNLTTSATIGSVSWRYELPGIPAGATLSAQLCYPRPLLCEDISRSQSGSTERFSGRSAAVPLFIQYRVNHKANFAPLAPKPAQIIVNWRR
ncbi:flagellar protein FlhE [Pseudomonas sp. 5P_3.1_Bac2]|uniref:flagellar protein FlhE n=1 Tax=Pseudomonas sp. 5P_3.1_Bac2 TaxID=2971617 RepID=UPI0021C6B0C6|nr:flagellar protein FlhE [Pseudomonas sp. 5P_3.1_Bac2]MCU1718356.1 flagellar protein FlhE [Pseudomonas sp. 5P_3.1_Bac2]